MVLAGGEIEVAAIVRVTIVLPSLRAGGAERVSLALADGLVELGHQTTLLVLDGSGPLRARVPDGVELVDLGVGSVRRALPRLSKHIDATAPDVVISHLTHLNVAVLMIRRRIHRLVVVEQNVWHSGRAGILLRDRLYRLLARRLYRRADAVVAVSGSVAESLRPKLSETKVSVIQNPIPVGDIQALAGEPIGGVPPRRFVLAVGRLAAQKNFGLLLGAFAQLGEPDCALVILGEGPDRAQLEVHARELGIESRCHLLGTVENPYQWMRAAEMLVSSSLYEGLPTVLREGLAVGVPIVATDCPGGTAEVLDGGRLGTLVPSNDTDALAKAMREVLGAKPLRIPRIPADADPAVAARRYLAVVGVASGGE